MKRFIEGTDRNQVSLLPECVDEYVAEDKPVRVIEAFVEQLEPRGMGFEDVDPEATGRPEPPATIGGPSSRRRCRRTLDTA
jgi:transposase